ncbi:hypothetical protein K438DRAFT_1995309 [Mycena galopus ATCC 62051]|nr:hypothetical protein K438DRAFT_1995309 [Mycena galopus ATCC 62051]
MTANCNILGHFDSMWSRRISVALRTSVRRHKARRRITSRAAARNNQPSHAASETKRPEILQLAGKKAAGPVSKSDDSQSNHVLPPTADYDGSSPAPPTDTGSHAASSVPTSLHHLSAGPSGSRSSLDITSHPVSVESYELRNLRVQHLPAALSTQDLPPLPPSPDLETGGYLSSRNSSIIDLSAPAGSPDGSRPSEDTPVASRPCLGGVHPRIFPALPETLGRYTGISNESTILNLPPLISSVIPAPPPLGWTRCQNPGGARYFYHEGKVRSACLLTDGNLFDNDTLVFINDNVRTIDDFLCTYNIHLELDVDLVLDQYMYANRDKRCQYYFANHQDRSVFWLDDADSDLLPHEAAVEGTVFARSTDAFFRYMNLLCCVRNLPSIVRDRVLNFHGEPAARLSVDQSVYATVQKRPKLLRILIPLLFYAPSSHLSGLHATTTDQMIRPRLWSDFVVGLNSEWREFIVYATVVLNANVAFLAIQSVDNNGITVDNRSAAQISSYLSMLMSIGSIFCGLMLVKMHRNRDRNSPWDAAAFIFFNRKDPVLSLETVVAMYSLPGAPFMWSMISFLAAFLLCFDGSNLLTHTLVAMSSARGTDYVTSANG